MQKAAQRYIANDINCLLGEGYPRTAIITLAPLDKNRRIIAYNGKKAVSEHDR